MGAGGSSDDLDDGVLPQQVRSGAREVQQSERLNCCYPSPEDVLRYVRLTTRTAREEEHPDYIGNAKERRVVDRGISGRGLSAGRSSPSTLPVIGFGLPLLPPQPRDYQEQPPVRSL
jgi:hypothetical protein